MSDDIGKGGVRSVQLALDVLEQVAAAQGEIGVSELAVKLGTTKGSVFRHLKTLVERGYLSQNPATSRYRLGIRTYVLGQAAASGIDLLSASGDAMRDLREELGLSVVLSVLEGGRLTVVTTNLGKASLEIGVRPGTELHLHCNAQGKVVLAFSSRLMAELARHLPLQRYTEYTIVDPGALEREVHQVMSTGYGAAFEEETLGISALAAPIFSGANELAGTLAIVGTVQHIPRELPTVQVDALRRAALRISWNLGYKGLLI
ncbi:transcriptional regulator [Pseudomonas sp. GM49]|uniref:IclR family transcriptional regulator n=1 Tax=Pseudomonas sp. GM49 TaxID=1144331 RepID=UPI0002702FEE|nr:IclR family transcriptional regulator [Pseudomonas sp. GM49]EJM63232.1 transcriptional regulator [Pseudomonas sp. GM49]